MTTAGPSISRHSPHPHPTQTSYNYQYRHHPYAPPTANANGNNTKVNASASSSRQRPRSSSHQRELPPSPPRSRRDASETPSIGLGVAFGGSSGGKWWDEELPPPPASLSSILDSFRKSGEGDRELLLSILGAKKAEEERLTALIQTRLTILQARLSLHSAAASLPPVQPASTLENGITHAADQSPSQQQQNDMQPPLPVERTPSLSSSRGGSSGMPSPSLPQLNGYVQPVPPMQSNEKDLQSSNGVAGRGYWQLPSLQSSLRASPPNQPQSINLVNSRSPNSPSGLPLAPIREVRIDDTRKYDSSNGNGRNARSPGSLSPRSTISEGKRSSSGLEMLLDAGRVVNESAERGH
ncbi:uncharacterized protein L201_000755 [Kwoniella dendrophila CBS 6074]|uniref:Uncharacterized protein n=1 Tax=Kwoniella dendrophila CBS 6074 TaxID=1295534 RepID=A0AAX4JNA0_9TREE